MSDAMKMLERLQGQLDDLRHAQSRLAIFQETVDVSGWVEQAEECLETALDLMRGRLCVIETGEIAKVPT